ncbi:MAG: TonB-dependent receptor [Bacteroidota bacterium]
MCAISYVQGQTNPLEQKISITFEDQTIGEAFRQLGHETAHSINYSSSKSDSNRRISKKYSNTRLADIIQEIWGNDKIKLAVQGKTIDLLIIEKAKKLGKGSLQGQITDDNNEPIPFATIAIKGTSLGAVADESGIFEIKGIPVGSYVLAISSMGYEPQEQAIIIEPNTTLTLNIEVFVAVKALDEIVVEGQSEATLKAMEPMQVTVLESKELRVQPIGAQDLIKRSTGVQVRQQGGLGSNVSINLNGLTGNSVRIYYDGVPIEFLGGTGLALNALPIGLIDRVDVYKGVIPVDIGTDALGGGINIVPRRIVESYLEVSYQVGSFNTHRANILAKKEISPNLIVGITGFYNYSDNNYRMRDVPNLSVEVVENNFGQEEIRAVENRINIRRFHNTHQSYHMQFSAEVYDTKWADRLSVAVGYTDRFDELQHGVRVARMPFGEVETTSNQTISSLNYTKSLGKQWKLTQISNFSYTRDFISDSTTNIYDWNGKLLPFENERGAELGAPTNRRGKNIGTSHRTIVSYSINPSHSIVASNFYGYNQIFGEDPFGRRLTINDVTIDPNEIKSPLSNNIFGVQYESIWLKEKKLSNTSFYKNYRYRFETIDSNIPDNTPLNFLPRTSTSRSFHGGGTGFKYEFSQRLFLRTSYERSIRLPTVLEIFGNFSNILRNANLRPERSHNVNLGIHFKQDQNKNFQYDGDLNFFLRDQEDLIRPQILNEGIFRFVNEGEVSSRGFEFSNTIKLIEQLSVGLNFTYQKIIVSDKDDLQFENQIPNIPDLFFNSAVSYTIPNVIQEDDQLNFFWNYFYVDPFSILFVQDIQNANPDNIVPSQHEHIVGLTYTDTSRGLSFSAQLNNVFDNTLFDNFSAPRPSRNLMFKLSYKLSKNK